MAGRSKPNELRLIRVYDAPVAAVWAAWSNPAQLTKWWGPRGFSTTTHSMDFRPGGTWRYTMHGPDGTDYPNVNTYLEVEKHQRLVYDHGANEEDGPHFRVRVTFAEAGGKTTMDMTMTTPTAEAMEHIRLIIKKASGNSTWDRLAEYVEEETTGKKAFVIARAFQVPLARMFEMWTKPEHVAQWMPPAGFTMEYVRADIRAGGESFYSMTNGTITMYGRARYLEIERPTEDRARLVYTQEFTDKEGNTSRHPAAATFPAMMLTIVTFAAESAEETRVSIHWEPQGTISDEELQTFLKFRPGMTGGWTGSLDKLEALVGQVQKA